MVLIQRLPSPHSRSALMIRFWSCALDLCLQAFTLFKHNYSATQIREQSCLSLTDVLTMDSMEEQNQKPAVGISDVSASDSDVNVVDFDSAGVNSDDVGISLPDVEEMKTDIGRRSSKTRQCWTIGIAVVCLLAIVIGLSVGLTGNNSSSSASANSGSNTTSDNEGDFGFDGTGSFDRYMQVYNALSESEISPPENLKVLGTPANLACNWMANGDDLQVDIPASLTEVGSTTFLQRYVLSHMYFHLKGPAWTFGDDFLTKKTECNWNRGIKADGTPYTFGVSCEDGKTVSQIFMRKSMPFSLNLSGPY
jgi:hypothetical protein